MPEGHNGNFDKGQRPSAGELQARAAEKIITEAQPKTPQPNVSTEGAATFSAATMHDLDRLKEVRQSFQETFGRKQGAPRLITAHGVATTHAEVDKVFTEIQKASDKNLTRRFKEAAARLNTFNRLPFGEKLLMLISGAPTDMDTYNEILEQERKRQGL